MVTPVVAGITRKTVSLSATKVYDGTTDLTGRVTVGNLVGSETLGYTGAVSYTPLTLPANKRGVISCGPLSVNT